jgi:O-antigen/teichoic acid export membrane protein
MIKNSVSNLGIFLFLLVFVNIIFLDPLQCFVYLVIVGLFTWIVARAYFQTIKRDHGSFQSYVDSLDMSANYARRVKGLTKKLSWLGPSSERIFLYSVGENIVHES